MRLLEEKKLLKLTIFEEKAFLRVLLKTPEILLFNNSLVLLFK